MPFILGASLYFFVSLFVCLFVCLVGWLVVCLFCLVLSCLVLSCLGLFVCLFVCLLACLFVCLFVWLFVLFACASFSVSLPSPLFVCLLCVCAHKAAPPPHPPAERRQLCVQAVGGGAPQEEDRRHGKFSNFCRGRRSVSCPPPCLSCSFQSCCCCYWRRIPRTDWCFFLITSSLHPQRPPLPCLVPQGLFHHPPVRRPGHAS